MVYPKNIVKIICLAFISCLALLSFTAMPKSERLAINDQGFAVVELFTSEGCSSCPPADALVAKIQREMSEMPVYILAFHVDYWNRLGWKDVFSEAAYSSRQNQYSGWLNASVYTPQIVLNGSQEFVGSDERKLRSSITTALHKTSPVHLTLNGIKKNDGKVSLQYQIEGQAGNSSMVIALVEKTASTKVLRGENQGRTLTHVQIVRNFRTVPLKDQLSGVTELEIAEGLDKQGMEIIAFLQFANGEIAGATKAALSN